MKWLFAALLVLQAHFAASYLVPLDREAQGDPPDGGSVDRFAGWVSTWTLPVLTLLSATWATRGTRAVAAWYGLSVGLLVAGMCGLLFFWPNDLPSLALFALTIAAGFGGGVIGWTGRI